MNTEMSPDELIVQVSEDELIQHLMTVTHELDKELYPGEKVAIHEWMEHEYLGALSNYTSILVNVMPCTIYETLYVDLPDGISPPSVERISEWLRKARLSKDPKPLFLYEDTEEYFDEDEGEMAQIEYLYELHHTKDGNDE